MGLDQNCACDLEKVLVSRKKQALSHSLVYAHVASAGRVWVKEKGHSLAYELAEPSLGLKMRDQVQKVSLVSRKRVTLDLFG